MRSKKSASRLFLGTFLAFMSCMDESVSENSDSKGSRCYAESILNNLKFSMEVVDG